MNRPGQIYEELLSAIDDEAVIDDLRAMVAIPSENPFDGPPSEGRREREIGEFMLERLATLGFETGSREFALGRPNVWGRLKGNGNGPALMLAGHTDTVGTEGYVDPFNPRVENDRVYGRGSCDMKAAIAGYLEVARLLSQLDVVLKGDLIVAGVADEEWGMLGSKDMGANGPWADFGMIGEPTELTLCPAHKGEYAAAIRTFGKAVHASVPELGINAIEHMAQVIGAFADYNESLKDREPHALCGHGRFSLGTIRGGTMVATVPDFCEIEVDRRTIPGETSDAVEGEYRARLEKIAGENDEVRYELSAPLIDVPPLDVPLDSPIVRAARQAFETVTGAPPKIDAFSAATDAPNLGFPTVIFGPGSLAQAHTLDEYVEIEEVKIATRVYLRTALELLV